MATGESSIILENVGMVADERTILQDINLRVDKGDFLAITGPNGGGKTTLLRILLRLLRPTSGRVIYLRDGQEVKSLSIGYLPQKNMIDSRFPVTVSEVIAMGLLGEKTLSEEQKQNRLRETIELVGLESHVDQSIGRLSGGQLQRALLGRAIISQPKVLVLDEPLSYVDKKFEHKIYDIIDRLKSETTILLVSHEMSTIASMATRHVIVDHTLHFCHSGSHFVRFGCDE